MVFPNIARNDLPPTPADAPNGSGAPGRTPSPSRREDLPQLPLLPPIESSGPLLLPPSPNPGMDNFSLPPPSPSSPSFKTKQKKGNPLIDLMDSEREYVELLGSIIRVRLF